MKNFSTCIWLDDDAEAMFEFYQSVFKNVKRLRSSNYTEASSKMAGRPVGSLMTLEFDIEGQEFMALNGGPMFKPNPSISFYISCPAAAEVDEMFKKLSDGGTVLMPLDKYPFSERFAWLNDKFGVSWQINVNEDANAQKITPALMFVGKVAGKAEEAMRHYTSIFDNSKILAVSKYEEGEGDTVGLVKHGVFALNGQRFIALDSTLPHAFSFNEGVSFIINCKTQEEVNNFWTKLCEGGRPSQCGWLVDKFGVSWQIVPTVLAEMMSDHDPERYERVVNALMQMTKLDIAALVAAYEK